MSTDSVALLRDYTIGKKPITLFDDSENLVKSVAEATTIKFDTNAFPRDSTTIIKKGASSDEHYTLDTLIFLVENANLDNSAYFKECRGRHIEHVSIVDRRKILDYLTGKVDQIPNVSTQEKRQREESSTESSKKQKTAPVKKEESSRIVKQVQQRERELKTYDSILKSSKNFAHAITLAKQLVLGKDVPAPAGARSSSSTAKPGAPQSGKPATSAVVKGQKLSNKDRIPLIIVPAAPTAMFTLYNIKQFLEEQKYVDAQVLREEGLKKPERVTVERKKPNGQSVPYHVVDSVANFKQTDWDRVCCVFVAGQLWQFKGWKWEKPVELFSNVKGFFPKWTTDKVLPPASEWAITDLNIHHHKRHMDKSAVSGFWDALDSYNATHKSYLNF